MTRHLLNMFDLSPSEAHALIESALIRKRAARTSRLTTPPLIGRSLGLLFEKPSLRTRVSFEAAIAQLGGTSIFLSSKDVGLGQRESIADFARVISQYIDALAVRTYRQETIQELARYATVPVINALSDQSHPCQAMADMLTIRERFGRTQAVRLVFVGDGNNVARSLAVASALLGADLVLACPEGYAYPEAFVAQYTAAFPDSPLRVEHDPPGAVANADCVYTDVWASMGQEDEAEVRRQAFAAFQVNQDLMSRARPDAIFLHCLPAHRGEEVTDEVLDGPQSQVLPQAANRLHFQKELLSWLLASGPTPNGRQRTRRGKPQQRA